VTETGPKLYHKALRKAYADTAGYERIFPAKLSAYRKKRYTNEELPEQIIRRGPLPKAQKGTEQDIIKLFAKIYKKQGWDKYAKFDNKGGFNQPYILFKAKNMIDPKQRRLKWAKVRPIAPGTKHPMRKLLHYVGRAWSYVTREIPGEHCVINKTSEVPEFFREVNRTLTKEGKLKINIFDIEGCYPNMPKETIRFAMRNVLAKIQAETGHSAVCVPRFSDTQPCSWSTKKSTTQRIPFQVMLDVMEFSLDNAMVMMPGRRLLRQCKGIPMGDPISPGMTIGTCAWMENEWMQSLAEPDKRYFRMKRFMDDICVAYVDHPRWDSAAFLQDLEKSHCYQEPLKLEAGRDGTFLETRFWIENNRIRFKLKNDNETHIDTVWRYQHWESNSTFLQKRATLTACLRKVQSMASDPVCLGDSALAKIAEFRRLRYPLSVCQKACNYLGQPRGRARGSLSDTHFVNRLTVQSPGVGET